MKIPQFKVEDGMIVPADPIDDDDHDCHLSPDDGCDHPSHEINEIIPELDDVVEETF